MIGQDSDPGCAQKEQTVIRRIPDFSSGILILGSLQFTVSSFGFLTAASQDPSKLTFDCPSSDTSPFIAGESSCWRDIVVE